MLTKSELRKTIRQRKRQFSRQTLERLSLAIIDRLQQNEHFANARTIFLYCSLPDEVDTAPLLRSLLAPQIILPRVIDDENMELRLYTGPADLTPGCYGINEPTGPVFTSLQQIDVAVVPGMAFDRYGHRLGRGRGYYDRILPLMPQAHKIGLCFNFQMLESIPSEPHDIIMDEVMSVQC